MTWLTNNFSWRFFGFFEEVTLKKKNGQEEPRPPRTGNPYPWAPKTGAGPRGPQPRKQIPDKKKVEVLSINKRIFYHI